MARSPSKLYVPLDVGFFRDDKVLEAGEKSAWLFLRMMTEAKLLRTDGVLTKAQIGGLGVPGWQARLRTLIDHGLVVPLPLDASRYLISSWEKWNELESDREARLAHERELKAQRAAERAADRGAANGS